MSAIHYKFSSSNEYKNVTFDGLHISLLDLKKAIMEKQKLKNTELDLHITNSQTLQAYTDESALIPKNTAVLVRRIPLGPIKDSKVYVVKKNESSISSSAIATKANQENESAPKLSLAELTKTSNLAAANASEEDKIKAAIAQSTNEYDPANFVKPPRYGSYKYSVNSNTMLSQVRCYRCNQQGHYSGQCPLPKSEAPKQLHHATGIPRSHMVEVSKDAKGAMLTSDGKYVVPVMDKKGYEIGKKERPPFVPTSASTSNQDEDEEEPIPDELICLLCKDLLVDAVVIPCCGNSYCDECIRNTLLESESHQCPTCQKSNISPDSLIANKFLRQAVNKFRNDTGIAKKRSNVPVWPRPAPTEITKLKSTQQPLKISYGPPRSTNLPEPATGTSGYKVKANTDQVVGPRIYTLPKRSTETGGSSPRDPNQPIRIKLAKSDKDKTEVATLQSTPVEPTLRSTPAENNSTIPGSASSESYTFNSTPDSSDQKPKENISEPLPPGISPPSARVVRPLINENKETCGRTTPNVKELSGITPLNESEKDDDIATEISFDGFKDIPADSKAEEKYIDQPVVDGNSQNQVLPSPESTTSTKTINEVPRTSNEVPRTSNEVAKTPNEVAKAANEVANVANEVATAITEVEVPSFKSEIDAVNNEQIVKVEVTSSTTLINSSSDLIHSNAIVPPGEEPAELTQDYERDFDASEVSTSDVEASSTSVVVSSHTLDLNSTISTSLTNVVNVLAPPPVSVSLSSVLPLQPPITAVPPPTIPAHLFAGLIPGLPSIPPPVSSAVVNPFQHPPPPFPPVFPSLAIPPSQFNQPPPGFPPLPTLQHPQPTMTISSVVKTTSSASLPPPPGLESAHIPILNSNITKEEYSPHKSEHATKKRNDRRGNKSKLDIMSDEFAEKLKRRPERRRRGRSRSRSYSSDSSYSRSSSSYSSSQSSSEYSSSESWSGSSYSRSRSRSPRRKRDKRPKQQRMKNRKRSASWSDRSTSRDRVRGRRSRSRRKEHHRKDRTPPKKKKRDERSYSPHSPRKKPHHNRDRLHSPYRSRRASPRRGRSNSTSRPLIPVIGGGESSIPRLPTKEEADYECDRALYAHFRQAYERDWYERGIRPPPPYDRFIQGFPKSPSPPAPPQFNANSIVYPPYPPPPIHLPHPGMVDSQIPIPHQGPVPIVPHWDANRFPTIRPDQPYRDPHLLQVNEPRYSDPVSRYHRSENYDVKDDDYRRLSPYSRRRFDMDRHNRDQRNQHRDGRYAGGPRRNYEDYQNRKRSRAYQREPSPSRVSTNRSKRTRQSPINHPDDGDATPVRDERPPPDEASEKRPVTIRKAGDVSKIGKKPRRDKRPESNDRSKADRSLSPKKESRSSSRSNRSANVTKSAKGKDESSRDTSTSKSKLDSLKKEKKLNTSTSNTPDRKPKEEVKKSETHPQASPAKQDPEPSSQPPMEKEENVVVEKAMTDKDDESATIAIPKSKWEESDDESEQLVSVERVKESSSTLKKPIEAKGSKGRRIRIKRKSPTTKSEASKKVVPNSDVHKSAVQSTVKKIVPTASDKIADARQVIMLRRNSRNLEEQGRKTAANPAEDLFEPDYSEEASPEEFPFTKERIDKRERIREEERENSDDPDAIDISDYSDFSNDEPKRSKRQLKKKKKKKKKQKVRQQVDDDDITKKSRLYEDTQSGAEVSDDERKLLRDKDERKRRHRDSSIDDRLKRKDSKRKRQDESRERSRRSHDDVAPKSREKRHDSDPTRSRRQERRQEKEKANDKKRKKEKRQKHRRRRESMSDYSEQDLAVS